MGKSPINQLAAVLLGTWLACASPQALAQVSPNDLQVAGRALGFLERPLSGDVTVGIVHDPRNPQSVREAENIERMLRGGLTVGSLTLRPSLLPVGEVGRSSVQLYLLASGVGAAGAAVREASAARRVPCVTTDLAQVRDGNCVMGVRSSPRVEILVNRATAVASQTAFSPVFRMMISEI